MVFLRQRGTKYRHDAIAQDLVNGSAKSVDGVDHGLQNGQQVVVGFLRVVPGDKLGRANDIGKQYSNKFALAAQLGQAM